MTETGIVIAQRGGTEMTRQCVAGLRGAGAFDGLIVVVDDGTEPRELQRFREWSVGRCEVVAQSAKGVTSAWNRGGAALKERATELIFLNNDVVTTGPWWHNVVLALDQQPQCVVGLAWREERVWPVGAQRTLGTNRLLEGWCLGIRSDAWNELQGFDDSLVTYFSDTDLQLRAVTAWGAAGLQRVAVKGVTHWGHRTARRLPERRTMWQSDKDRFLRKWSARRGVSL